MDIDGTIETARGGLGDVSSGGSRILKRGVVMGADRRRGSCM